MRKAAIVIFAVLVLVIIAAPAQGSTHYSDTRKIADFTVTCSGQDNLRWCKFNSAKKTREFTVNVYSTEVEPFSISFYNTNAKNYYARGSFTQQITPGVQMSCTVSGHRRTCDIYLSKKIDRLTVKHYINEKTDSGFTLWPRGFLN